MLRTRVLCVFPSWFRYFFLMLLLTSAASGQTFRGGINGSVTDASGAAIPNAALQAVNDATGVTHSTLSSSAGEYSFVDLPLGAYTVTATATGFQTLKVDRVPVTAGSLYSLPLKLAGRPASDDGGGGRRGSCPGHHDDHADHRCTGAHGSRYSIEWARLHAADCADAGFRRIRRRRQRIGERRSSQPGQLAD